MKRGLAAPVLIRSRFDFIITMFRKGVAGMRPLFALIPAEIAFPAFIARRYIIICPHPFKRGKSRLCAFLRTEYAVLIFDG